MIMIPTTMQPLSALYASTPRSQGSAPRPTVMRFNGPSIAPRAARMAGVTRTRAR